MSGETVRTRRLIRLRALPALRDSTPCRAFIDARAVQRFDRKAGVWTTFPGVLRTIVARPGQGARIVSEKAQTESAA